MKSRYGYKRPNGIISFDDQKSEQNSANIACQYRAYADPSVDSMKIPVSVHENEAATVAESSDEIDALIESAADEASSLDRLNIISFTAPNGNYVSLVVGSDETVVIFTYSHHCPPYYASKGSSEDETPVLTAFVALKHKTEFPRKWVIPLEQGIAAVHGFTEIGELPETIEWVEQ